MRRVIGIDIHRTFGEVVIWENGLTRHEGRVGDRQVIGDFGSESRDAGSQTAFSSRVMASQIQWASALDCL